MSKAPNAQIRLTDGCVSGRQLNSSSLFRQAEHLSDEAEGYEDETTDEVKDLCEHGRVSEARHVATHSGAWWVS